MVYLFFAEALSCGLIVETSQGILFWVIVERIGRSRISLVLQFDKEFHKFLPQGNIGFRDIDLTGIIIKWALTGQLAVFDATGYRCVGAQPLSAIRLIFLPAISGLM